MDTKEYYVYIMSNASYTLYVGVTSNLEQRVHQHKHKVAEGFTSRYKVSWLVYYASTNDVLEAIAREKQIKGWTRAKKIALIREFNPMWKDLSLDWYDNKE